MLKVSNTCTTRLCRAFNPDSRINYAIINVDGPTLWADGSKQNKQLIVLPLRAMLVMRLFNGTVSYRFWNIRQPSHISNIVSQRRIGGALHTCQISTKMNGMKCFNPDTQLPLWTDVKHDIISLINLHGLYWDGWAKGFVVENRLFGSQVQISDLDNWKCPPFSGRSDDLFGEMEFYHKWADQNIIHGCSRQHI